MRGGSWFDYSVSPFKNMAILGIYVKKSGDTPLFPLKKTWLEGLFFSFPFRIWDFFRGRTVKLLNFGECIALPPKKKRMVIHTKPVCFQKKTRWTIFVNHPRCWWSPMYLNFLLLPSFGMIIFEKLASKKRHQITKNMHSLKLTASLPMKIGRANAPKGNDQVFQPSIFRCFYC